MHAIIYVGIPVGLAALLFAGIMAYLAVTDASRSIHELALDFAHVAKHGAGLLERRLTPSNVTEIRILQNALCTMLEQIRRGYELQVKNRETEIEKERILAASRAKNRVFANISHEIRTPMNAIIGISDILLGEGGLSPKQEAYIQTVQDSANTLLEIVNEVLDMSKLEAGKMQLKPIDYNFKALIESVCSLAVHLTDEKGLGFDFVVEGGMPECLHGDDVRLRQILLNLIGNAVKYTKRGGITLRLENADAFIRFTVVDTGFGIPPNKLLRLFEPFEQMDDEASRHINGTGLGLTISRGLTELMGGTIRADSEYGKGSVFVVVIPKIPGDAANLDARNADEEEAVSLKSNARILVVDDNGINLNVSCGLIQTAFDIQCDTAQSGPECVGKAEKNIYDLIFMDHMMPGMDGVETAGELRKKGGYLAEVPIIALTANAVNGMKDFFLKNGMNGFLSKPILKKELKKTMKRWLGTGESKPRKHTTRRVVIPTTLEEIPDLNVSEGIEYNGGRADVYMKSLRILREMIPGFAARVRELLAADDLHELTIHIHGMKASLAGVGAANLSAEFLFWERSFLAGKFDHCREELPRLLVELEHLRDDLAFIPLDKESADTALKPTSLTEEVAALRVSLVAYDYDAVGEHAKRLRKLFGNSGAPADLAEVFSHIEQFDYEGALARLNEARPHTG